MRDDDFFRLSEHELPVLGESVQEAVIEALLSVLNFEQKQRVVADQLVYQASGHHRAQGRRDVLQELHLLFLVYRRCERRDCMLDDVVTKFTSKR